MKVVVQEDLKNIRIKTQEIKLKRYAYKLVLFFSTFPYIDILFYSMVSFVHYFTFSLISVNEKITIKNSFFVSF